MWYSSKDIKYLNKIDDISIIKIVESLAIKH